MATVIAIDEIEAKASTCGPIREFWQAADGSCDLANLIVLPGQSTQRHWHEQLTEVYLIVRGTGVIEVDGEEMPVGARSAVVIAPKARHDLRNVSGEELELYVLAHPKFDPDDVHHEV